MATVRSCRRTALDPCAANGCTAPASGRRYGMGVVRADASLRIDPCRYKDGRQVALDPDND